MAQLWRALFYPLESGNSVFIPEQHCAVSFLILTHMYFLVSCWNTGLLMSETCRKEKMLNLGHREIRELWLLTALREDTLQLGGSASSVSPPRPPPPRVFPACHFFTP